MCVLVCVYLRACVRRCYCVYLYMYVCAFDVFCLCDYQLFIVQVLLEWFAIQSGGAVANRLRRRTSDQTVLGSNPAVAAALSPWTRLFTPIVSRRSLHISFY